MRFDDFGKKMFYFGLGLAAVTKEKIEELVNELVKTGEIKQQEMGSIKEKLLERAEEEKRELLNLIRTQVKAVADELGFVTRDEIDRLKRQLKKLEKELKEESSQK